MTAGLMVDMRHVEFMMLNRNSGRYQMKIMKIDDKKEDDTSQG